MARRTLAALATTAALLAISAPTASATFHLIQIREVYPGSIANPDAEYVELQMWTEDQNHVASHVLRTYDAGSAVTGTDAFATDVLRGADQSTLVLATPAAEAEFGFTADAALSPPGRLDPSGGAVCWESIDCVAWGSFAGSLPSPAGNPAATAGIPDGMALRRSIASGCATLLEPGDDHDNSAADFGVAFPGPRPNSVAPSERPCGSAGGSGTGGGGSIPVADAPTTQFRRKPPRRSRDRTPTFRFGADQSGAEFECRLDRKPFRSCRSPLTIRKLHPGPHRFEVRAVAATGEIDRSPASYGFKILPRR